MTMLPPDMTPLPTNCTASSLLINEVQTGPGTDEFIEIYNPCGNAIDADRQDRLSRRHRRGRQQHLASRSRSKAIAAQGLSADHQHRLHRLAAPDLTYTNVGMADGGGGVGAARQRQHRLRRRWRGARPSNGFQHGSAAGHEGTGKSIARQPNGANSDDDSVDFQSSTPTPGAAN